MTNKDRINFIMALAEKCKGLDSSGAHLVKGGDGSYIIEYEGYETLVVTIKPSFGIPDEEINALMNLYTYGVSAVPEIVNENIRLQNTINALIDALTTLSMLLSSKNKNEEQNQNLENERNENDSRDE